MKFSELNLDESVLQALDAMRFEECTPVQEYTIPVILEGRDITTVVFPNANYKFYLDASLEERANRRYKQNMEKGIDMSYEEIK